MSETPLATLALKVGSALVIDLAKRTFRCISEAPYFLGAVRVTAERFSQFEGLHKSLTSFCNSKDSELMLNRIESGERDPVGENLVSSFVETTGFFNGDATNQSASEILTFFLRQLDLALYRSDDALPAIAARQEALHQQTREMVCQEMTSKIADLKTALLVRSPVEESTGSQNVQDKIWDAEIDTGRNLLNRGKARTAHALLEDLRSRLPQSASAQIHVRLAINLGVCALHEDDLTSAEQEFDFALRLEPNNPKALANRAQVELLRGNLDVALDLARRARTRMPMIPIQLCSVF